MDKKQIEEEAKSFFEWPDESKHRDVVTMFSCILFAEMIAEMALAEERERWEAVVLNGLAVLKGLDEKAVKRTTHQNVSDTLDALMRVLRA